MAFGLGCLSCCVPCDPCEAECDESPAESFQVAYQEANPANLTWNGDAMGPLDGPWPGFESGSVFSQTITTADVTLPSDRFPCFFRLKLWRNVGGGEGSDALDHAYTTVTCIQGKVDLGFVQLKAGESMVVTTDTSLSFENATYIFSSTTGGIAFDDEPGDRHAFPPSVGQNTGIALCAGTSVSVQSKIVWSNDLIQHNLYGQFQECYENTCELDCSGTPTEFGSLFLSISNQTSTMGNGFGGYVTLEDNYVLEINSDPILGLVFCGEFRAYSLGSPVLFYWYAYAIGTWHGQGLLLHVNLSGSYSIYDNTRVLFGVSEQDIRDLICGDVASLSGTTEIGLPANNSGGLTGTIVFDWELTA